MHTLETWFLKECGKPLGKLRDLSRVMELNESGLAPKLYLLKTEFNLHCFWRNYLVNLNRLILVNASVYLEIKYLTYTVQRGTLLSVK